MASARPSSPDMPVGSLRVAALAATAGAGACLLTLYFDLPGWDDESKGFMRSGKGELWTLLLCAQMAFWFVVTAALAPPLVRGGWAGLWGWARAYLPAAIAFLLLAVVPSLPLAWAYVRFPLGHHHLKIGLMGGCALLAGLTVVLHLFKLDNDLSSFPKDVTAMQVADAGGFVGLRERLAQLLWALGLMVSLVVLATATLREAYNADSDRHGRPQNFEREAVLAYGGWFTLVLLIFYVPVDRKLAAVGRRVCDRFHPLPASDDAGVWQEAYRRRKEFEGLIEADRDWPEAVRSGVAILSPLVAAIASVLVGGK